MRSAPQERVSAQRFGPANTPANTNAQWQGQQQAPAPSQQQARAQQHLPRTEQSASSRTARTVPQGAYSTKPPATAQAQPPVEQRRPAPPAARTSPMALPPGVQAKYSSVPMSARYVALTFDDGPHGVNTPKLLDILRQYNAKATFYVVGPNVERYPQIMRRMVAEGHEVGNHTWNHPNLVSKERSAGRAAVQEEIDRATEVIVRVCGVQPKTFRPPYGSFTQQQSVWLRATYGMPSILWNVDPRDWQRPGVNTVANRLISGARPGGILLAHDIHAPTISAIPQVLERLSAQGYRFVTVSQLISLAGSGDNAAGVAGVAGAAGAAGSVQAPAGASEAESQLVVSRQDAAGQ